MTEIDLHRQPTLLEQKMMFAEHLSKANLLPVDYRGKAANVLLAIEAGEALGIAPITAINMIHVIQGKPTISSQLMASLVRNAGHRLRVQILKDDAGKRFARASLWRKDDPEFEFTAEWTWERATQAGLTSKDSWKNYSANMLKARAISEVCRDACPEVLAGISYTPDELGEPFLTDVERADAGLMTRHELAEHSALERTPHDSSRTVRVHAGDADTAAQLWESPPADCEEVAGEQPVRD